MSMRKLGSAHRMTTLSHASCEHRAPRFSDWSLCPQQLASSLHARRKSLSGANNNLSSPGTEPQLLLGVKRFRFFVYFLGLGSFVMARPKTNKACSASGHDRISNAICRRSASRGADQSCSKGPPGPHPQLVHARRYHSKAAVDKNVLLVHCHIVHVPGSETVTYSVRHICSNLSTGQQKKVERTVKLVGIVKYGPLQRAFVHGKEALTSISATEPPSCRKPGVKRTILWPSSWERSNSEPFSHEISKAPAAVTPQSTSSCASHLVHASTCQYCAPSHLYHVFHSGWHEAVAPQENCLPGLSIENLHQETCKNKLSACHSGASAACCGQRNRT